MSRTRSQGTIAGIVAPSLLAVSLATPATIQAGFDSSQTVCRDTVAKEASKVGDATLITLAKCHKLRGKLAGDFNAGTDCNAVSSESDPKGKVARAELKLHAAVGGTRDRCVGLTPSDLGYGECPAPCEATGSAVDFTGVADCVACLSRTRAEALAAASLGLPASLPLASTDAKCHGTIAKSLRTQVKSHLKVRSKCQSLAEQTGGVTDHGACSTSDSRGKIQRSYDKGSARIANACAAADPGNLDSCGQTAEAIAQRSLTDADTHAKALFQAYYPSALASVGNPILFVTQVPTAADFLTSLSTFGHHRGGITAAPRGGDLYIRYGDGTLRNLTQEAGYGVNGHQDENAIAVRDPKVHWSGTKALFSMVIGAPPQYQHLDYFWQIYEVSGFGAGETVNIVKLPNQPASFNNVNAIYGSDDRIIFVSDMPRTGEAHLYPQLDEYESSPTNTGLWSLNPTTGDLFQLNHSPSGSFEPLIDSYGRIIFTRWDHLQRDQQADAERINGAAGYREYFNWSDETALATQEVETEYFPEPRGEWVNFIENNPGYSGSLAGYEAHVNGHSFNQFFPWMLQQDGKEEETLNHIGRHELLVYGNSSFNDDPSLVEILGPAPHVANTNRLLNFFQIDEDPNVSGDYYGVRAPEFGTHASGQVVKIGGAPTVNPDSMAVSYQTHPDTANTASSPSPDHTGLYRDPVVMSGGAGIVAAHTGETRSDRNEGSRANPEPRYDYRLKLLEQDGAYLRAGLPVNPTITKSVTYYDPDVLVTWDGPLWELQPAEVIARSAPTPASVSLPAPEAQVLADENVNPGDLEAWLKANGLALIVSRDVTTRDAGDEQQPFNLRVPGTATQTVGNGGTLYDVQYMRLFQGDQIRGSRLAGSGDLDAGRRVIAVPLHDPAATNPPSDGPEGSVTLGADGSMAALVPARRAMSWELTDADGNAVVRERYWLSFQPGEVRVCASCHGVNTQDQAGTAAPVNEPEALRELLQYLQGLGEL